MNVPKGQSLSGETALAMLKDTGIQTMRNVLPGTT